MNQQERRLAEVEALLLKHPHPVGNHVVGSMVAYYNPDAPPGHKALVMIFLQSNGSLVQFCHADLPSLALAKARDFWALRESWYAPKIDKRRTTDPMVKLAKALDKLTTLVGTEEDEHGPA